MISKIKAAAISVAKKSDFLRALMRNTLCLVQRIGYTLGGMFSKVDRQTVLLCSFGGRSYCCSPKAIYLYMKDLPQYKGYRFVWAFNSPEEYDFLNCGNTSVIRYGSKEYKKALHTAGYWIFNSRTADYIYPQKGQVYLQCWHGTPLKRLGYDIKESDNAMNSVADIRRKYRLDAAKFTYLLSPSAFASEKFTSAWNLAEIGKEDIILEAGYPRDDLLACREKADREGIRQSLGLANDGRRVILYAPTWRDNQHKSGVGYTYDNPVDFDRLKNELGDKYVILFRAHYLVANSFDFAKYDGFIKDVSDYDDINDLYLISDLLITDYSSVFFDYSNLRRPMIFYMYDMESYAGEIRGFYFDIDELPGEIVKDEKQLIKAVLDSENFEVDGKYERFNRKYNYLNDGNAAERVCKKVFGK